MGITRLDPAMSMNTVPDYTLRAACPSDIPFLTELREITMGPVVRRHQPWIPEEQAARILHRFDCARVIARGGRDVGLWKAACDLTGWELIQIQLLPDCQGLGIGSHLIRGLQDECRRAGRDITLQVFASNPALKLYQRLGFQVAGRDEHSFRMIWRPGPSGAD